jgi:hypothetical protein
MTRNREIGVQLRERDPHDRPSSAAHPGRPGGSPGLPANGGPYRQRLPDL